MVRSTSVPYQVFCHGKFALKNGRALVANLCSKNCNLQDYSGLIDQVDTSSKLEEEDEIMQRQNEEDVRLYGSRSEPIDAFEDFAESPTKGITTDYEAPFDEAEKAYKTDSNAGSNEACIYNDESAEVNPLSAWLARSALPSVVPMRGHPLDHNAGIEVDTVKEEIREIEVFRNVHLASDPEIYGHATEISSIENPLDLELPSQIYYRNIVDRYPLLPTYLARRLAEANRSRAERLSLQRDEAMAIAKDEIKSPVADPVYDKSARERETKDDENEPLAYSRTQAKKKKALNERKTKPPNYMTRTVESFYYKRPKADKKRANSYASLFKSQPQFDYWSGGSPHYRTKPVGSRSSSRNSSLHGSPKFCYQRQYQNIDYFASKPKYHYSSPSLPPPPVKLRKGQLSKRKAKKLSFDCDICGEKIEVDRRRQWQYVVVHECHWSFTDSSRQETRHERSPAVCLHCSRVQSYHRVVRFPR